MTALTCDTSRPPKMPNSSLRLSTGTVQCADPDLKREALSELFDYCMTPITSPRTLCPSSSFVHERTARLKQRARPLSAAPALELELTRALAPVEMASGMPSPLSPSHVAYTAYFNGIDGGADDEGGSECDLPAVGTFADLRRKLYGGELQRD
ncbi:hypothetical protein IWW50_006507 [Coemansia erecta]|nr:hypothetical protein GGF43_001392 [Coemansia sp. RSA 2618]KAJ2816421.1 hypothetical protein IWW50_006507 [Coemansia erecta]